MIGLGRSRKTIGIYIILARRFLEYADDRTIDASLLSSYRDEMAPKVDSNTWRSYALGLNSFLTYLKLDVRFEPPKHIRKEAEPLRKDAGRLPRNISCQVR